MFNHEEEQDMHMVELLRHERFQLKDDYRCPHCQKLNVTESIHDSFKSYDASTFKIWATCGYCQKDFQLQGWAKIRKAAVPAHSICRCGRHFVFSLQRDADRVRFAKRLGYPYVKCPNCKRKFILHTPYNPLRYFLAIRLQRMKRLYKRQCKAIERIFSV